MIDLHLHTTASDGEFSPSEIVEKALGFGLTHIAITDHDTIKGLNEAISYSLNKNIDIIPGVELNSDFSGRQMHMLGYYIDINDSNFLKTMEMFENGRNERNYKFIKCFNEMGINISFDDVKKFVKGSVVR